MESDWTDELMANLSAAKTNADWYHFTTGLISNVCLWLMKKQFYDISQSFNLNYNFFAKELVIIYEQQQHHPATAWSTSGRNFFWHNNSL